MPTRRRLILTATAAYAGQVLIPYAARAAAHAGDAFPTDGGQIVVHPVNHASFVMETPGLVIYNDPVGDPALYAGLPPADLILVSHEHGDHFNVETLTALTGEATKLVTNPAVLGMLPEALRAKAAALANGESRTEGPVAIDAIPAYNSTPDRQKYHPQGRDNGYVLKVDGRRVYIAGDTEDIPEMRALKGIDIAFVPMNLPYTMSVEQAAAGVNAFRPAYVYPYHYGDSDLAAFAGLVEGSEVKLGAWYG